MFIKTKCYSNHGEQLVETFINLNNLESFFKSEKNLEEHNSIKNQKPIVGFMFSQGTCLYPFETSAEQEAYFVYLCDIIKDLNFIKATFYSDLNKKNIEGVINMDCMESIFKEEKLMEIGTTSYRILYNFIKGSAVENFASESERDAKWEAIFEKINKG